MTPQYRIKELNGKFTIEIPETKVVGHLWWKKEVQVWRRADIFGMVYYFIPDFDTLCPEFKTQAEAMEQIAKWFEEPKYHYLTTLTDKTNQK